MGGLHKRYILSAISLLLFLFCYRIWGLGVTHNDDASWLLSSLQHHWNIIHVFGISQGRIWAYISGPIVFFTLSLQGSIWGEFLRTGSFLVFFIFFYYVIALYFDYQVALLAAILNLGLFAMRWEGSLITTYPAFAWILTSLFLLGIYLGHIYSSNGKIKYLVWSLLCIFISMFTHEGVSVLFALLCLAAVLLDYQKKSFKSRMKWHFLAGLSVTGFYFFCYGAWRFVFPTVYEGNSFGKSTLDHFFPTWFGLSTSGSVLSDAFRPYYVRFSENISGDGYAVTYDLFSYLKGRKESPSGYIFALIVLCSVFFIFRSFKQQVQGSEIKAEPVDGVRLRWFFVYAVVCGLLIAFVPILPVALVGKYQLHFFEIDVRSYVYTCFSHFGITLSLAAVLLYLFSFLRKKKWTFNLLTAFISTLIAVLSFCGYYMNDAIVDDIRLETSRWQTLDQIIRLVDIADMHPNNIYIPRLAGGTWFGVGIGDYWRDYIKEKYHKDIEIYAKRVPWPTPEKQTLFVDFKQEKNSGQSAIFVAPLEYSSKDSSLVASKIFIALESEAPSDFSKYSVSYFDLVTGHNNQRFFTMAELKGHHLIRSIENIHADPSSIRLNRVADVLSISVNCQEQVLNGLTVFFGDLISGAGNSCLGQDFLYAGWNGPDAQGVWSNDEKSSLDLPTVGLNHGKMLLDFALGSTLGFGLTKEPQQVLIKVNGLSKIVNAPKDIRSFSVKMEIPEGSWVPGKDVNISFNVDRTFNPKEEKLNADDRDLGVFLKSIRIAVDSQGKM